LKILYINSEVKREDNEAAKEVKEIGMNEWEVGIFRKEGRVCGLYELCKSSSGARQDKY
jgi:hypothetical protein